MFDKPFRLHFSSVIENLIRYGWAIIVLLVTSILQNYKELSEESIGKDEGLIGIGALLILVLILFFISFWRWRKTYITLNEDTIIIEKRLLLKSKTTIGIKNISTVNLEQNILERIFQTYQIKIDTNSLTTADKTDVKIILKEKDAIAFRKEIIARINKEEIVKEDIIDTKKEHYDVQYDYSKVLQHTFISLPLFGIIYSLGIIGVIIYTFYTPDVKAEMLNDIIGFVIGIVVVGVPALIAMFNGLVKLYDFKAKRENDKINISYGLFTKRKYTIPVEKINAVIIKQPIFARIFKKYTVELVNIGMGEENEETPVLLLMSSKKEIEENMKKLLPELDLNFNQIKQSKNAVVPIAIKVAIITTVATIIAVLCNALIAIIPIVGFAILVAILMYITKAIAIENEQICITNGVFLKKSVIIRYNKIQKIEIKNNIINEKLGIRKAELSILASMTNINHGTGYFEEEIFEKISEKFIKEYSKT